MSGEMKEEAQGGRQGGEDSWSVSVRSMEELAFSKLDGY